MSASVVRKLQQARRQLQNGDIEAAAASCEDVLRRAPRNPDALWLLGTARLMVNRVQESLPFFERAVVAAPEHGAALEHLGLAHLMLGRYVEAEEVLRKAAAISGAPSSVAMRLGLALLHQGRHSEAIDELSRALRLDPANLDAHLNLGRAYGAAEQWAEAQQEFEHVLARDPDHADALYNLGIASMERGENERARSCFERIVARDPAHADAHERLALVHVGVGRYAEAIPQLREVLRARPADVPVHVALANACFQMGALDEAQREAKAALELDTCAPGAHSLLALIHYVRGELDQAIATLETGCERTAARPLLGLLVHLLHRTCEWEKWRRAWEILAPHIDAASDIGSPFWLLCEATTAQQQLSYTRRWAAARFGRIRPAAPAARNRADRANRRLRVGYFSSDFQEHAVAHLLIEALERHDRERFEIYAYSYGPDDGSEMRARIRSAVEHFVDVAWEPDDAVVKRMRADQLDMLVDLRGYTAGDRLEVMAQRPCPLQVTWLGYPGTTGADFIDYVIADQYIIPEGAEVFYSEQVLRLPNCYQANDRKRTIDRPLTRREYGLPEHGFVFCCFNQAVKIMPEVFARWMSLLRRVPDSVLWVLEDNRWASANLKQAAAAQGVDPERLVMGTRLPNPQHLARLGAADLALDTFPYTSHTTASDALWMGCPLVALEGETFAARVSTSIVSNCGLADLVTRTLDDYEKLAHRLATDADFMREVRMRLAAARETAPLFDSERFARDLEALYLQIAE